jgi:phosphatidylserine/phosphatidylglycerophosphate/cardiolipin synthase-like enzyme
MLLVPIVFYLLFSHQTTRYLAFPQPPPHPSPNLHHSHPQTYQPTTPNSHCPFTMPSMFSTSRETPPSSPDPSWTSQPARPNARSTVPWNPKNQSPPRTHRIPAAFLTECDDEEEWLPPKQTSGALIVLQISLVSLGNSEYV